MSGTQPPGRGESTVVVDSQQPRPGTDPLGVWALVQRVQAGETAAFGPIYVRYHDYIHKFVYLRVGDRQVAEDLTSETFTRALRRIDGFTWRGRDFGAWLVTIARNLVADRYKSGQYRREVPAGNVHGTDVEGADPEDSPETAVVAHLTNLALLAAVAQLQPEQRLCIALRFFDGLSVAQTAQVMGKNEGAVKAMQWRATRSLARSLPRSLAVTDA